MHSSHAYTHRSDRSGVRSIWTERNVLCCNSGWNSKVSYQWYDLKYVREGAHACLTIWISIHLSKSVSVYLCVCLSVMHMSLTFQWNFTGVSSVLVTGQASSAINLFVGPPGSNTLYVVRSPSTVEKIDTMYGPFLSHQCLLLAISLSLFLPCMYASVSLSLSHFSLSFHNKQQWKHARLCHQFVGYLPMVCLLQCELQCTFLHCFHVLICSHSVHDTSYHPVFLSCLSIFLYFYLTLSLSLFVYIPFALSYFTSPRETACSIALVTKVSCALTQTWTKPLSSPQQNPRGLLLELTLVHLSGVRVMCMCHYNAIEMYLLDYSIEHMSQFFGSGSCGCIHSAGLFQCYMNLFVNTLCVCMPIVYVCVFAAYQLPSSVWGFKVKLITHIFGKNEAVKSIKYKGSYSKNKANVDNRVKHKSWRVWKMSSHKKILHTTSNLVFRCACAASPWWIS